MKSDRFRASWARTGILPDIEFGMGSQIWP